MAKSSRKKQSPAADTPVAAPEPVQAGFAVRLAAMVYDVLLLIAVNAVIGAIVITLGTPKEAAAHHELTVLPDWFRYGVQMPVHLLATWLFYAWFWRKAGQTLGMQTWRLKVVRHDGRYLGWGDSFARCAFATLFPLLCGLVTQWVHGSSGLVAASALLGFLCNYLWIFCNARGLTWHDQLSRTLVLRMPPEAKKKRERFGFFSDDD